MHERLECEVLQKARYINTLTFTFTWFLSPPKVNQFFGLVGPIITSSFNKIGSLLLQVMLITESQNDKQNDSQINITDRIINRIIN